MTELAMPVPLIGKPAEQIESALLPGLRLAAESVFVESNAENGGHDDDSSNNIASTAPFFQRIEQRAQQKQSSVEDELLAVVTAVLPDVNDLPDDLAQDMAQLAFLTDAELEQAASISMPWQATEQMQALMLKRQREGLTAEENNLAEQWARRYDRTMLIRAQAAALLQARGHCLARPDPLPTI